MKQNDITDVTRKLTPQNYENLFNVYFDDDNQIYYYNLLRAVNFPEDLNPALYNVYETIQKDTWPLIAWKFYRNVKLWWVITSANQILNPLEQPKPGTQLKIVDVSVVKNILAKIRQD